MTGLKLTTETRDDGVAVVRFDGELDVYTAPWAREHLRALVAAGRVLLVADLEPCEYLDSTGLGVLVGALQRARAKDGAVTLVCTRDRLLQIFVRTGLTKVFGVHATVDEAARSLLGRAT